MADIPIPLETYTRLLDEASARFAADTDRELDRSRVLAAKIREIAGRARSAGVTLGDADVAASPVARDLRREMDEVAPEYKALMRHHLDRMKLIEDGRIRADAALRVGAPDVLVPTDQATLLLDPQSPEGRMAGMNH